jgi:hypothetical protein
MPINIIATSLMPISQAVSWYMVLNQPLYRSVFAIALFYCLWALYNRFLAGVTQELGQYSMGLAALATWYKSRPLSMAAACLVLLNFGVPAYYILWKWDATEVAKMIKNDTSELAIVWARVFKAYFVSSIALWITILYKFYRSGGTESYEELPLNN